MFLRLFLLFTVVPALELWLLFQVGQVIGIFETVWLILCTGLLGSWMAKREGGSVLQTLLTELQSGVPPAKRIVEGVMILTGGVLLITPGVLTDLTGFLFIIPWTRRPLAPLIYKMVTSKMKVQHPK